MDISTKEVYRVELTKEEFTVVTKALCQKLKPEEAEAARELGKLLLERAAESVGNRLHALTHARTRVDDR